MEFPQAHVFCAQSQRSVNFGSTGGDGSLYFRELFMEENVIPHATILPASRIPSLDSREIGTTLSTCIKVMIHPWLSWTNC